MTEREAVAAVFGASVAFRAAIEVMRHESENDKYSESAREAKVGQCVDDYRYRG